MRRSRLSIVLLGLVVVLAGCRIGKGDVRYAETGATLEGTVTYGKDKVGAALIIAQNETGSATAFVDDDGHFKLENVPLGEVNLGVNTNAGKGQAMGRAMAKSQGKATAAAKVIDVPVQFADPARSGIKTTINKGTNSYDIVIQRL